MVTVNHNGHTIQVKTFGTEKVFYDGKEMSSKFSVGGKTHSFTVKEENKKVQYDIDIDLKWHGCSASTVIRRDGKIIYSDK